MSTAPRLSVVVPAFNRERYLGAAIDSVRAQTFEDWELVVFDDGSTDGTVEVARRYADKDARIRVASGPNGGVASARNRGWAATDSRSEFVIFFDSDDVWEPDALATLVGVLDDHPEYVSAHSLARSIDGEGQPLAGDDLAERSRLRRGYRGRHLTTLEPDQPTTFADLAIHNWILTPGTQLIRRRVLTLVGPFDVETDPADDWDLAVRVSRHGDSGFVDRPLLQWRRHDNTLTNTSPRWRRAYFLVRRRMLTDPSNTPEQTQAARLAYGAANRAAAREARTLVADRCYRAAGRQSLKAGHQYLLYLRADLPTRLRRHSRTAG
jgi:glycosyltransferase involved in cell wall biosynthesis